VSGIIWLHEDALRADHPVFAEAGPETSAWFVWDEAYLREMDYGFKRLLFIYETLLELPVTIVRGSFLDFLPSLAARHGHRIWVPETPNPRLIGALTQLSTDHEVNVIADAPFVRLPREPDLKRFFRYWNLARKPAMSIGGTADGAEK
jgi:hypothetical protein